MPPCLRVTSIAFAALSGVVLFPVVLVFGPGYFPWTLLVLASFGIAVGLSIDPRGSRSRPWKAFGLAALTVAVILGVLVFTSNIALGRGPLVAAVAWAGPLLLPTIVGVLVGAWLRARMGLLRGAGVGTASVAALALVGAGLALALAPPEVAGAPTCAGGYECPRVGCAQMAERRRFLAIERVTAFDGEHITCTYTAWGGVQIGHADIGPGVGSWTDGRWPEILSGRVR